MTELSPRAVRHELNYVTPGQMSAPAPAGRKVSVLLFFIGLGFGIGLTFTIQSFSPLSTRDDTTSGGKWILGTFGTKLFIGIVSLCFQRSRSFGFGILWSVVVILAIFVCANYANFPH